MHGFRGILDNIVKDLLDIAGFTQKIRRILFILPDDPDFSEVVFFLEIIVTFSKLNGFIQKVC